MESVENDHGVSVSDLLWFENTFDSAIKLGAPEVSGTVQDDYLTIAIRADDLSHIISDLKQLEQDRELRLQHRDLAEEWARYEALRGLLSSLTKSESVGLEPVIRFANMP